MKSKLKYTGIRVRDMDASIRFYTTILGMTLRSRETIGATGGTVADLATGDGGHPLELNYYAPGSPFATDYIPGEGLDHLGFQVEDLDRTLDEARRAGHPVVQEISAEGKKWFYIQDPNGIWIELFG